jgi:DNA repair ATPase RecN
MDTPDKEEMSEPWPKVDKDGSQPLALFFGVRRSHPTDERINVGRTVAGQAVAFADALSTVRALHLADIAFWMLAQEVQAEELPRARLHLDALKSAAAQFLPTCTNLRAIRDGEKARLLITKGGVELDVRHLSEGERGMLALALDLARRLSQANPALDDPVRDGEAVVLIDELDMHMHPSWQRQIAGLLTRTFQNCQFIATTHSPQIFGEVMPAQIRKIEGGKVYIPDHSYGVDSSRLLEEEMGTSPRNAEVAEKLDAIAELIGEEKEAEARDAIDALAEKIGDTDPEITRARLLLEFLNEGGE